MSDEIIKGVLDLTGTIIAAIIVGVFGARISRKYSRERDRQDKESQWRQHAIELTKLDLERMLKQQELTKTERQILPSILDFLANYRDLQELGSKTPKELYLEILEKRIAHNPPQQKQEKK